MCPAQKNKPAPTLCKPTNMDFVTPTEQNQNPSQLFTTTCPFSLYLFFREYQYRQNDRFDGCLPDLVINDLLLPNLYIFCTQPNGIQIESLNRLDNLLLTNILSNIF